MEIAKKPLVSGRDLLSALLAYRGFHFSRRLLVLFYKNGSWFRSLSRANEAHFLEFIQNSGSFGIPERAATLQEGGGGLSPFLDGLDCPLYIAFAIARYEAAPC